MNLSSVTLIINEQFGAKIITEIIINNKISVENKKFLNFKQAIYSKQSPVNSHFNFAVIKGLSHAFMISHLLC